MLLIRLHWVILAMVSERTLNVIEAVVNAAVVIAYAYVTLYVISVAEPFDYLVATIITVSVLLFITNLFRMLRERARSAV